MGEMAQEIAHIQRLDVLEEREKKMLVQEGRDLGQKVVLLASHRAHKSLVRTTSELR